jgi:uncharacterized protein
VDIVRYDSIKHLTDWMESKDRQDLLAELDSIVESRHSHRVTGLEGWFAINRGPDESQSAPPSWKRALAVLFALYPTVMALNYVNPLMGNLSFPVKMLISNMLSVALLTWFVMPPISRFLGFWLTSNSGNWRRETMGLFTVAAGIALFVVLFSVL